MKTILVAAFVALLVGSSSAEATSWINGHSIKPHSIPLNRLHGSLPRGRRGPRGATGATGPAGSAGKRGANGQSVTSTTLTSPSGPCTTASNGVYGSSFTSESGTTDACTGPRGPQGPAGGTSASITEVTAITQSSSCTFRNSVCNEKSAEAQCPSRTTVIGGGFQLSAAQTDPFEGPFVETNRRDVTNNAWLVDAETTPNYPIADFTVYAYCLTIN
jgi:hypothetical protein